MVTYLSQRYCKLIQPQPEWTHWSEEAEKLHGISRQMLSEFGVPATRVCADLNALLTGQTIYSDGWVVDYPWLIRLFHAARMPMNFSLSPLENILSEYQMSHWHEAQESICATNPCTRHRASSDAELIQSVYMQTQHYPGQLALEI